METLIAHKNTPDLLAWLSSKTLTAHEKSEAKDLGDAFRAVGFPNYCLKEANGGPGLSIADLIKTLRLVGARCPSLSIMMTMHHHSVAALDIAGSHLKIKDDLLSSISHDKLLLSSAFAEAVPKSNILHSSVKCSEANNGWRINGSKKPCTMANVSDLILIGVSSTKSNDPSHRGVALVSRTAPGISTEKFWPTDILQAADSNKITFTDTPLPADALLLYEKDHPGGEDIKHAVEAAEITALSLFQLMISASYLGVASRLVEISIITQSANASLRSTMIRRLESTAMSLYFLASAIDANRSVAFFDEWFFARCLMARKNAEHQITATLSLSTQALGGMNFLRNDEIRYLLQAGQCIKFHPPASELGDEIIDQVHHALLQAEGI